jgi:hypothetical protein
VGNWIAGFHQNSGHDGSGRADHGKRGLFASRRRSKMIGIQAGAISFLDDFVEKFLDIFQERASVNTLFLAVFTYGRSIAGRQVRSQPLPDDGKPEYDLNFHGGNFATPHRQTTKTRP